MDDNQSIEIKTILAQCEGVIERGMRSFIEVGTALLKIRDGRLYRENYPTFDEYCRERWGWRRRNVDQQIKAAEIAQGLSAAALKPENENQVRPLGLLPPEDREAAWNLAVEHSATGNPTGPEVAQVVNTLRDLRPPKTKEQIEAERKVREAEKLLDLRHEQELRRFIVFSKLIDAVKYLAHFQMESVSDTWDGITNAGGHENFAEHVRMAQNFLMRMQLEKHPNADKKPTLIKTTEKDYLT